MKHKHDGPCGDPRCSGYDRGRVFRNVNRYGAVAVTVYDAHYPFAYTVGLFANHQLPELMMMFPDLQQKDELATAMMLFSVADYLATLPIIDEGTFVPAAAYDGLVDLWLWNEDERNHARANMGIGRDYYREFHMRRIENVPVFIPSPKEHPAARAERTQEYVRPRPGGIVEKMIARAQQAVGNT